LTLAIVDGIWVLLSGWSLGDDIVVVYSFLLFWCGVSNYQCLEQGSR
jgi:hypothetical protein